MSQVTSPRAFSQRLEAARAERGPLCAGIDPHAALLQAWGLADDVSGLERFSLSATEALAPVVGVLKPQSAFFERFGSAGVAVLERVVATARQAGALVLLDVKRGDIGSTAAAYAAAYLDPRSPLAADAMTASPFLGTGSLEPLFEAAHAHGAGVFVIALTSNPEGPEVQHATTTTGAHPGSTVAGTVLAVLRERNRATGLGALGAVVGATIGETDEDLDIGGPLLVPGIGAQGGTADDVRRIFGGQTHRVLPSVSREVLRAGPDPTGLSDAARRLGAQYQELLG